MPLYLYSAKTQSGQTKTGTLEAANERDLAALLRQQQLLMISVQRADSGKRRSSLFDFLSGVSLVEKMVFTQHLAVMVESGLNLSQALKTLAIQSKSGKFKKILGEVESNVRQGRTFSDSLSQYPKVFSELYVNMVKVGETAGNLEEVLKILADQMKKDHDLVSRVKGAMVYPGVILAAMIAIGTLMMIVVVPQLKEVFDDMEIELPETTRAVLSLSDFIKNNIIMVFLAVIIVVILIRLFSKTTTGKRFFHAIYKDMPLIGNIVKKINAARFARTFSALIDSGVSIVKTLEITSGTLSNYYFKHALLDSAKTVQKGQPLSQSIGLYKNLFPPMVVQMIEVGEETGNLSDVLKNLANFYEAEIDNITKNLSSIIEPILMIIIGIAVGFFAVSMIQPMYSMMGDL